ncbi:uncharacterized protein [Magallana gigas]|uniref:uncharacterized protein isoform X5 n=1 Tax=Magallana gigas TaxID=29159 RepID=UPI00333EB4FB
MAIVFLYTFYLILNVLYESAAIYDIDSKLCLETAVAFMYDKHKCHFDIKYAQENLEHEITTCQDKCDVEIKGVNDEMNTLWNVDITLGRHKYYYYSCPDNKDNHNMLTMLINCPKWNEAEYTEWQDEYSCCGNFDPQNAIIQSSCISHCLPGYTMRNEICSKRNLALNQSCSFSEQCAGSPYASCLEGYCSCMQGYTARNSTDCVQSQKITFSSSEHNQETINGTILGALFGGLLLGVILTTVVLGIIYSRFHTHVKKREELNVTFTGNDSSAKVSDLSDFQNIQAKHKKSEASPNSCSKETSVYDQASKKGGQIQDDVYNHLHEQVKQEDVNYYDHACAASVRNGDMSDYSHIRHATS